jgi:hypothetical protein
LGETGRQSTLTFSIEAVAVFLYFGRDAFAGAFRYYTNIAHLDALWFVADLAAFMCVASFTYRYVVKQTNTLAIFTLLYMIFSLYLGFIFLNDVRGLLSAFKMIAPVFVGFCFCGREIKDYRFLLSFMHALFYLSIIGIIWSSHVQFPWVGYEYEAFGKARVAGTLWWSATNTRLAGFAADNTMASYFVLITYVFTSTRSSLLWCITWAPVAYYANNLTTNKTSNGVLVMYVGALLLVRLLPERYRLSAVRRLAVGSFICVLAPILLMIALSGTNLAHEYPGLFSLQDRVDNSWQLPFVYLSQLMPLGFLTGCGLGCFNYPQQLFSDKIGLYVPVDNFYIGTYLMIGPIFIVFLVYVILAVARTSDIYKLTIVFVMNLYTITILSYGPASGLLIIALGFSEVFNQHIRSSAQVPKGNLTFHTVPS